jgi:hypothetical protein
MLDGTEQTLAKRQPKCRGKGEEEEGKEPCETKRAAKGHDEQQQQQQQQQQQEDGDSEPKAKRLKLHTTHASLTKAISDADSYVYFATEAFLLYKVLECVLSGGF